MEKLELHGMEEKLDGIFVIALTRQGIRVGLSRDLTAVPCTLSGTAKTD